MHISNFVSQLEGVRIAASKMSPMMETINMVNNINWRLTIFQFLFVFFSETFKISSFNLFLPVSYFVFITVLKPVHICFLQVVTLVFRF